jgi:phospholipase A2
MTNRLPDHFHVPGEDDETEEQVAYEKQIWLQHDHSSKRSLDRGLGRAHEDGGGGSALKTRLKSFVRELKDTSQSAARLVSLESRLTKELGDPARFPEIAQQAVVRKGLDLCPEETTYLAARRLRVRDNFANYMGLDAAQVHPDDIPTVSFGGSGGGYRAMLAFLGYSLAMKEAGVWDLLTYVAGVSGSCE